MKVLITGGTGFLGSHLVEGFLARGDEVHALIRKREGWLSGLDAHRVQGDLTERENLEGAIASGFDLVVHVAGLTKAADISDYWEVNTLGTYNLLSALRVAKQRPHLFVYVSSQAAGGPGEVCEDDPPGPVTEYGESKLYGEYLVRDSGLPSLILRPPVIFGPRDRDLLFFFRLIKRGWIPSFFWEKRLSLLYVKNLVSALMFLLDREVTGLFYVADGDYSWIEVAEKAAEVFGVRLKRVPLSQGMLKPVAFFSQLYRCLFSRSVLFSREKIKEMCQDAWVCDAGRLFSLGFRPGYTLEEALKETIQWYKGNGML